MLTPDVSTCRKERQWTHGLFRHVGGEAMATILIIDEKTGHINGQDHEPYVPLHSLLKCAGFPQ
jgi:hypothetical protein